MASPPAPLPAPATGRLRFRSNNCACNWTYCVNGESGARAAASGLNEGIAMDFSLSDEQQMIVKTTREFVVNELYPHEREVEETGVLREELHRELKTKAVAA